MQGELCTHHASGTLSTEMHMLLLSVHVLIRMQPSSQAVAPCVAQGTFDSLLVALLSLQQQ